MVVIASCSSKPSKDNGHLSVEEQRKSLSNAMLDFNAARSVAEFHIIDSLSIAWRWNSKKITGGIVYEKILEEEESNESSLVEYGDTVIWNIKASLINGIECYTIPSLKYVVGHSNQPQAFDELATKLRRGDSIRAIVPSLMAYGTIGVPSKVPPGALLVLQVRQN
ncbi:MAG: hypothetical protein COA49_05350 [Bacteroidetes bacterium]|nr:MAG: hypothetical protein COA49_05350 [Bacteroidota bacterium]